MQTLINTKIQSQFFREASTHPYGYFFRPCNQAGFSIIELIVALGVSMVLITAALILFSGIKNSQKSVDQITNANEAGSFLIKLIGRDLANASFYPIDSVETNVASALGGYFNLTGKSAYDAGIFGCEASDFNITTGTCNTSNNTSNPDSLVIGYFTNDGFGGVNSHRFDCEGLDVASATVNTGRTGSLPLINSKSPSRPLFVANHYTLASATLAVQVEGGNASTKAFSCKGLVSPGAQNYIPLISGIEDFQLQYGVYTPGTAVGSYEIKFFPASSVAAQGTITTVDGRIIQPWERVISVQVCVISKTYGSPASVSQTSTWTKCNGESTTSNYDGYVRKTYIQNFAVRNRLNTVY
ncbi:MAG: PilW family protein [Burkholderiales bacterium]